jgi:hypothetical protein
MEATLLAERIARVLGDSKALQTSACGPALPEKPGCVVVVGPSCSGKTTLVNAIRAAKLPGVFVATRYVTRAPRRSDSGLENVHLSEQRFAEYQARGEIAWSWTRLMQEGQVTRYGFHAAPRDMLPVYSANNALYRYPESVDRPAFIENALWVGACAPLELRRQRMRERSADLSEAEKEFRLADTGADMNERVHLLAHDYGDTATEIESIFCELVAAIREL